MFGTFDRIHQPSLMSCSYPVEGSAHAIGSFHSFTCGQRSASRPVRRRGTGKQALPAPTSEKTLRVFSGWRKNLRFFHPKIGEKWPKGPIFGPILAKNFQFLAAKPFGFRLGKQAFRWELRSNSGQNPEGILVEIGDFLLRKPEVFAKIFDFQEIFAL